MRLFLAINFDDDVRDKLTQTQDRLRKNVLRGNFTLRENLHMTLVFFGEGFDRRLPNIRRVMDGIETPAFGLHIGSVGRFHRNGGDIWWAGGGENADLSRLHGEIRVGLDREKLSPDVRLGAFTPHITLAREVETDHDFDPAVFRREPEQIETRVEKISLMKSERIRGKLVYTPVYEKLLR